MGLEPSVGADPLAEAAFGAGVTVVAAADPADDWTVAWLGAAGEGWRWADSPTWRCATAGSGARACAGVAAAVSGAAASDPPTVPTGAPRPARRDWPRVRRGAGAASRDTIGAAVLASVAGRAPGRNGTFGVARGEAMLVMGFGIGVGLGELAAALRWTAGALNSRGAVVRFVVGVTASSLGTGLTLRARGSAGVAVRSEVVVGAVIAIGAVVVGRLVGAGPPPAAVVDRLVELGRLVVADRCAVTAGAADRLDWAVDRRRVWLSGGGIVGPALRSRGSCCRPTLQEATETAAAGAHGRTRRRGVDRSADRLGQTQGKAGRRVERSLVAHVAKRWRWRVVYGETRRETRVGRDQRWWRHRLGQRRQVAPIGALLTLRDGRRARLVGRARLRVASERPGHAQVALLLFGQAPVDVRDLADEPQPVGVLEIQDLVERPVKVISNVPNLLEQPLGWVRHDPPRRSPAISTVNSLEHAGQVTTACVDPSWLMRR